MRTRFPLALLGAAAVLGSACTTTGTRGDDTRDVRLPTGVTLLESDRNRCDGAVAINEDSVGGRSRRADLVVQRGQNVTFEFNDDEDEVQWNCVGASDSDRDSADCPTGTTHVRITRSNTGDEFLLECFGRNRRS